MMKISFSNSLLVSCSYCKVNH
uniref:Uncharacterized protein n=1 Tax=Tetranychus urticae TaxID=32264 RepID=T1KGC7_TETUR